MKLVGKKLNNKTIISTIFSAIILLLIIGFGQLKSNNNQNKHTQTSANIDTSYITEDLEVYYIDVGQADSILIKSKDKSMLIDAGNNDDGIYVVNFIKEKGISKLDYVIGTHPHEDHIGGMDDVINNIDVGNIYIPKIQNNTKTFEDVLDAISNKNLKITSPQKGDTFDIGDAKCEIMTDIIENKKNLNLSSITIKMTYGNNSLLFMGDAETENEKTRNWEQIDVLKMGHHGSTTSSGQKFINEIKPKYAIIMVGKDNDYGHPKDKVLDRFKKIGTTIYRTDISGTIIVKSDGNNIQITTSK